MIVLSLFKGLIDNQAAFALEASSEPVSVSRESLAWAVALAARDFKCDTGSILSLTRRHPYVHARQYAMWLLRQRRLTNGCHRHSFPAIAKAFGFKDHTTVLHAVRAQERRQAAAEGIAA